MVHFLLMFFTISILTVLTNLAKAVNDKYLGVIESVGTSTHTPAIVQQPRRYSLPSDQIVSLLKAETNQGHDNIITEPENPNLANRKKIGCGCGLCIAALGATAIDFLIDTKPLNATGLAVSLTAGCATSIAGTCCKIAVQRTEEPSYKAPITSGAFSSIPSIILPIAMVGISAKGLLNLLCATGLSTLLSTGCQVLCTCSYYCPKEDSVLSAIKSCYRRVITAPQNRPHKDHDTHRVTNVASDN